MTEQKEEQIPIAMAELPTDFVAAARLLRSLIGERKLLKQALQEPAIVRALELVGLAAKEGSDTHRLEAVSLLGKASEISKPIATVAQPLLRSALVTSLPGTGLWGTAEDRYYLAKGVAVEDAHSWISSYAASELARAEISERASRQAWAELAITRAENLSSVLEEIVATISSDRKHSEYSIDAASRKLNRIAAALRNVLPQADIPIGEGFGSSFTNLVIETSGRAGPNIRSLREETAISVLDLMVEVLRLRFPATLESTVYHTAGIVLGWWKLATPPEAVMARAERIAKIAISSLHTLSRQGVRHQHLRQSLVAAFGADLVNKLGTEVASKDPSLETPIASWLSNGKETSEVRSNSAVRELTEQDFDELVARLLVALSAEDGGPQVLELLADSLDLLDPTAATTVRSAVLRSQVVSQWGQAIASKRRLVLSGNRGDLVPYDPNLHESHGELQIGAVARIKTPAIVKQQEGLPARVIIKSEVESR